MASSLRRVNVVDLWLRPEELARFGAIIDERELSRISKWRCGGPTAASSGASRARAPFMTLPARVEHYEGVLVDINSRKLAEEETNRARDRVRDLALETARLRSEFLASMSHEIRTPLVGIIGTGELLSHSDLNAEQRRLTEIIRSSGELLLTVVNDILDFSKLAAGRVVLEKLDFDLVDADRKPDRYFCSGCSRQGDRACACISTQMCRPACAAIRAGCARSSTTWWRTRSSSRIAAT